MKLKWAKCHTDTLWSNFSVFCKLKSFPFVEEVRCSSPLPSTCLHLLFFNCPQIAFPPAASAWSEREQQPNGHRLAPFAQSLGGWTLGLSLRLSLPWSRDAAFYSSSQSSCRILLLPVRKSSFELRWLWKGIFAGEVFTFTCFDRHTLQTIGVLLEWLWLPIL